MYVVYIRFCNILASSDGKIVIDHWP